MSTRQDSAAIAVFAPAKVNLALHVVGRRPDGYHELDTLVAFADIGDVLYAEAAGEISLRVDGRFAAGLPRETDRNLVKLAAERLRLAAQAAGHAPNGARLLLVKELPVASGIGGGSTDAAATLLALRELWDLPADFDLSAIAASLGADVMMCLAAVALRARGIGHQIEPLAGARDLACVLVNPGAAVATREIFASLAPRHRSPLPPLPTDPFDPSFLAGLRNDLEDPAVGLFPLIGIVLNVLQRDPDCLLARMSGSGATCFGLCRDEQSARQLRARLVDSRPEWWCVVARLGSPGRKPPKIFPKPR